jgi:hypothetical protein
LVHRCNLSPGGHPVGQLGDNAECHIRPCAAKFGQLLEADDLVTIAHDQWGCRAGP